MNGFTFDGRSTDEFFVKTTGKGTWGKPSPIYEQVSVPGRNGRLVSFTGAWENVSVKYVCGIRKDMEARYHAFVNFLMSRPGYRRLEDTYHPGYYRMAMVEGVDAPTLGWMYAGGEFVVNFSCKPQTFLKSGENVITLTASRDVVNPTLYASRPMLRVYGTGEFTIGGDTVTITSANGYTDFDCETENAYKDDSVNNCNGNIRLSGDAFPRIPAGTSRIVLGNGITRMEIVPRWWQL